MTEAQFNPRRVWFDELLALPHLWPEQVAMVRSLAEELGVAVEIFDRALDWNWAVNGWTARGAG